LPVFVSTLTTSPILIGAVRALWQAGWFLPQLFFAPTVEKRKRQLPLVLVLGLLERLPYLIIGLAILWLPKLSPDTAVVLFMILYAWKSFAGGVGIVEISPTPLPRKAQIQQDGCAQRL
jgi:hypothetical protein